MGLRQEWDYQIKAWILKLRSFPIELIKSVSFSEGYQREDAYIFKLENKKYALIIEEGCSCYRSEDAIIELYQTKSAAMVKLKEWEKMKRMMKIMES